MGKRAHGKTIQGVQAAGSLLKGDIMCPDHRCIRYRGTDDGRVYPLSYVRARTPVAPRSQKQGIEESLGLAGLMVDVIMPPKSPIQRKPKVLGRVAVRDRMACHGKSSWGDGAGTGEEDDLGFGRVKGKAAGRSPLYQAVHSTLDPRNKEGRVITTAEDGTIIHKGDSKGIFVVDEADRLIEG